MTITDQQAATKYTRYPSYKPSDINWLGDIPEEWQVKRLKYLSDFINGFAFDSESYAEDGIPVLRIGDIKEIIKPQNMKRVPKELAVGLERFLIEDEDILLALTGATIGKTAVFNSPESTLLNQRVAIIRTHRIAQKFLAYFIGSTIFKKYIDYLCYGGAQENIGRGDIGSIFVPFAEIDEQCAIADFLDKKTRLIDNVIAKKQKLIKLLKEKRQGVITHTVTKGLDSKAKMKPSGNDWLGDIPEDWEFKRTKYLGDPLIGLTYSPDDVVNEDEGILVLRSSNVQNGRIDLTDNVYVSKAIPEKLWVKPGDILICSRNGNVKLIGKNALIDDTLQNSTFGAFMAVFRSKNPEYIHYFFNSTLFTSQSGMFATSTINQLTNSMLKNMELPVPPEDTQLAIVKFLNTETAKIDSIVTKVKSQIWKLREYRQTLITNAVTGEIRVTE